MLLDMPNITEKSLFFLEPCFSDKKTHCCIHMVCSPCLDLRRMPLHNPHPVLFVDGSASRHSDTDKNLVERAAITKYETLISRSLPGDQHKQQN